MPMALFLLHVLVLAALPVSTIAGDSQTLKPSCQASCRGVDILYPFGIGPGCFRDGFEITCTNDGDVGAVLPVLADTTIQVVSLSIDSAELQVMIPVGYQCYQDTQDNPTVSSYGGSQMHPDGVYRISSTRNMLVVLGCMTIGVASSTPTNASRSRTPWTSLYDFHTGCMSFCDAPESVQDGACAGVGCCHVDIPPGLTDGQFTFHDLNHSKVLDYSPCDYAFFVDKTKYTFRKSDLLMPARSRDRNMPVWLDWAIRDNASIPAASCADAAKSTATEYACKSPLGECVMSSTNGTGYTCKCRDGYEGNAYLAQGCIDINECAFPDKYPCEGHCDNIPGNYTCKCRSGYQSDDPKKGSCIPRFPLAAQIAIGIILSISFLAIAVLVTLLMLQKRRMGEYFKKNGGLILKNVETLQIFTKEELNKITRNYSEFLGKGGFGKVYKGTLPDDHDTMVAVKSFIQVNESTMEEFTKEVLIQSKMIHKNILKLFGCCLEVDVPMLVYEFAAKGSLGDILHFSQNQNLPMDLRLDIAIGSAEGLKYMHLYASQSIRHGDVKPDNILLDGELVPKISDFGLSKMLKVDEYFTKIVVGCMGYMDPVFIKTGLLTQKSDVYSFGVVLLELISRKKIVYDGNCSLIMEFRRVYAKDKTGSVMFDKEITTEEDIFVLEEMGKLAMECLKEDVEDRPDMAEVAERLVMLRRGRKHCKAHHKSQRPFLENQYEWYSQEHAEFSENADTAFLHTNNP